jgi:hypothetical protein
MAIEGRYFSNPGLEPFARSWTLLMAALLTVFTGVVSLSRWMPVSSYFRQAARFLRRLYLANASSDDLLYAYEGVLNLLNDLGPSEAEQRLRHLAWEFSPGIGPTISMFLHNTFPPKESDHGP